MKRNYKILSAVLLGTSLLATGGTGFAADTSVGSSKAATDKDYTLEEMLTYAIQDEYMAHAEYDAIMEKYGVQKPFSNIINSEARHIDMLLPLFGTHDVAVPENDAANRIVVPKSLEESYSVGVEAEEKNIAMYESFLKEDLPSDVEAVFERLLATSENHLAAFEKAEAGDLDLAMGKGKSKANKGRGGIKRAEAGDSGLSKGKGKSNENKGRGGMNSSGSKGMGNSSTDCLME